MKNKVREELMRRMSLILNPAPASFNICVYLRLSAAELLFAIACLEENT
jgi:hypothetical protein